MERNEFQRGAISFSITKRHVMGCSFSLKKIFAWSLGAAEKNKKPKIK
jgi:hypothetical protein